MEGNKYRANDGSLFPTTSPAVAEAKFGPGWVEYSGTDVKLKTLAQISAKLNVPGEFLLVQGEEITTSYDGDAVHMNALNLVTKITPVSSTDVATTLNLNLAAIAAQAALQNRPILSHINHPNWDNYSVSPEEIAQAADTRFFEVLNTHSAGINHYGNATHPGMEKVWDIASTIRMVNMNMLPMYGIASDDTHEYNTFGPSKPNPGRAWVMVRAAELAPDALMEAMAAGDFYASTGVMLAALDFDVENGVLSVVVEPKAGVDYVIDFIGTPVGADPTKQPDGSYSAEIGKVLQSTSGPAASYTLTGEELYVRAHIRSNAPMSNPTSGSVQWEEAWTQPVGSWLVVPEPSTWVLLAGLVAILLAGRARRK